VKCGAFGGSDPSLLEDDEIKPIWAQGCGLFLARRESWLGFNKHFKGFGGEEGYIHEKYRKEGRGVWLIPWLGWWHRFNNPDTKHYSLRRYYKVRNYVLGFLELEKPLDDIFNHFISYAYEGSLVDHLVNEHSEDPRNLVGKSAQELHKIHKRHKLPKDQWDRIIENPFANDEEFRNPLELEFAKQIENDANDLKTHLPAIRHFAGECRVASEITRRSTSSLALALSTAEKVRSFNYQVPTNKLCKEKEKFKGYTVSDFDSGLENYLKEKSDFVFVKFPHTYDKTLEALKRIAENTTKYIAIHDTQLGYRPEITEAMKELVKSGDWFVKGHLNKDWGMTILTREEPEHFAMAWKPEPGVGAELKKLLSLIGITSSENCSCNRHAAEMDERGPEWCEENMETILGWLKKEADRRNLPFVKVAAKLMVKRAIRNYRKSVK
jgi:hypothetical protein